MLRSSSRLSNVDYALRGKLLLQAESLKKKNVPIVSLNIGNTEPFGLPIPSQLQEEMIQYFRQGKGHGYAPSRGIPQAIAAVQEKYKKIDVSVQTEHVFFGAGVSELARIAMDALLEKDDEVLLPAPCYPVWGAAVALAGGKPVYYLCDEHAGWHPDIHDIGRKISAKSRAILVINPNNPTGAVYEKVLLEQLANIAARHQLVILSDEIYEGVTYDDVESVPMSMLVKDTLCISFSGLSKIYRAPGLRTAWMTLSGKTKEIQSFVDGLYLLCSLRLSAPALPQYVVPSALSTDHGLKSLLQSGGRLWEQREILMKKLDMIEGLSYVKPKGAFYVFPKLSVNTFNLKDDEQFCTDFLLKKHVLLIHGKGFAWMHPDHFRIVFLADRITLGKAMDHLTDFLKEYRQE